MFIGWVRTAYCNTLSRELVGLHGYGEGGGEKIILSTVDIVCSWRRPRMKCISELEACCTVPPISWVALIVLCIQPKNQHNEVVLSIMRLRKLTPGHLINYSHIQAWRNSNLSTSSDKDTLFVWCFNIRWTRTKPITLISHTLFNCGHLKKR